MLEERRLASLGSRRPWANPWAQVTVLDGGFDDVEGIAIDAAEQVRLHGCVRCSSVALEAADHDHSNWEPVVYRGKLSKRPLTLEELWIPPGVRAPAVEPMWRESDVAVCPTHGLPMRRRRAFHGDHAGDTDWVLMCKACDAAVKGREAVEVDLPKWRPRAIKVDRAGERVEPDLREPWLTPAITEATPKRDVMLRELAEMSEVEFKAWLWASGHQLAHAEYTTRWKGQ